MGKNRRVKVPVILQMEDPESGAACLTMVLAYYRKWVPLDQVRNACAVSRDGIQPEFLVSAAEEYGLTCSWEEMSVEELKKVASFPAIALLGTGQYVVLCGFGRKGIRINHPAKGSIEIPVAEFEEKYAGTCLALKPGEDFSPEGDNRGILSFGREYVRANRRIVSLLVITGILATCGGIVAPVFYRVFTDDILTEGRDSWYPDILLAFAAVIIFELVAGLINQILLIRSVGKVSAVQNARYMRHIFRLPIEFFMRRKAGDLSGRQVENDLVSETFVSQLVPQVINMSLLILYILIMINYSITLTVVGVVTVVLNLVAMRWIGSVRRRLNGVYYRYKGNLDATTVSGIDMIETIKSTGSENAYFERWSGCHASMVNAQVKNVRATRFLANLPMLIVNVSEDSVMFVGFLLIIRDYLTAGMLLTFFQFMKAMSKPISQLVDAGQNLEAMGAAIDRVTDVMEYPEDPDILAQDSEKDSEKIDFDTVRKLRGQIELKNLCFGYSKSVAPVIENFNLSVSPGKRIALVGGSGSGKSTIAKLMTGLNKPWSGEILYDGEKLEEIPRCRFKASVFMVDQEVALYHDTIENNIKMWDSTIEDSDMIIAAKDAAIFEQIRARNRGFRLTVEPGGRNLSGGERQRIEIARVLSGDPTVLIMDEATSALDAKTESEISEAVKKRGITCIIIAHRLSTIRDCDEIIVLDQGKVIQRGTHEELMRDEGLYKKLIMTA